jgi:hypothetical protein
MKTFTILIAVLCLLTLAYPGHSQEISRSINAGLVVETLSGGTNTMGASTLNRVWCIPSGTTAIIVLPAPSASLATYQKTTVTLGAGSGVTFNIPSGNINGAGTIMWTNEPYGDVEVWYHNNGSTVKIRPDGGTWYRY